MTEIIFDFAEINKQMQGDSWYQPNLEPCKEPSGPHSARPVYPEGNAMPTQQAVPRKLPWAGDRQLVEMTAMRIKEIDAQIARERLVTAEHVDRIKHLYIGDPSEAIRKRWHEFSKMFELLMTERGCIIEHFSRVAMAAPQWPRVDQVAGTNQEDQLEMTITRNYGAATI